MNLEYMTHQMPLQPVRFRLSNFDMKGESAKCTMDPNGTEDVKKIDSNVGSVLIHEPITYDSFDEK